MKKVIRRNVFESASSSVHNVTVVSGEPMMDYPYVRDDGYVHSSFGEFGWEFTSYDDVATKLQYALTMVAETECKRNTWKGKKDGFSNEEEFYQTEGFQLINDAVKEQCDCNGVIVDDMEIQDYGDFVRFNGYIDHQSSTDDYNSLKDFLDDYGLTIERFLFDVNVVLRTGNDNV